MPTKPYTNSYIDHAAEIVAADGPTGDFAHVFAGEVRDAGGNVLFSGAPNDCVAFRAAWRAGVTHLVPTSWTVALGYVVQAGVYWCDVPRRHSSAAQALASNQSGDSDAP